MDTNKKIRLFIINDKISLAAVQKQLLHIFNS